MQQLIRYIEELKIDELPLPENWKGSYRHIGSEYCNSATARYYGYSVFGTVTFMSAIMIWAAERLKKYTETNFCYELAEAAFAFQFDWRYVDVRKEPSGQPDAPTELSAIMDVLYLFETGIISEQNWNTEQAADTNLSGMGSVVHYLFSGKEKKKFTKWLNAFGEQMSLIKEARPPFDLEKREFDSFADEAAYDIYHAPFRGAPIPPCVLDPDIDISTIDIAMEAKRNLEQLDHHKNRYLRSPEEMKALGFMGEPYKF